MKDTHKPLMIFIGLGDTSILPKDTERIVASANNPHVVRQPNIGHDFRLSKEECEVVMEEIENFLIK